MIKFINNFKISRCSRKNIFIALYLLMFYVLNIGYCYLQVWRNQIRNTHLSKLYKISELSKEQYIYYKKYMNISSIASSIENMIIAIAIIFLIATSIKDKYNSYKNYSYKKKYFKEYLNINLICWMSIKIISLIFSVIFSLDSDIFCQQVRVFSWITLMGLAYYIIIECYQYLIHTIKKNKIN